MAKTRKRKPRIVKRLVAVGLVFALLVGTFVIQTTAQDMTPMNIIPGTTTRTQELAAFTIPARSTWTSASHYRLTTGDVVRINFTFTTQRHADFGVVEPDGNFWFQTRNNGTTNITFTAFFTGYHRLRIRNNSDQPIVVRGTWSYTQPLIERITRFRLDETFLEQHTLSHALQQIARATAAFEQQFGLRFDQAQRATDGHLLNGRRCTNHPNNPFNGWCHDAICGEPCHTVHHRSALRLLHRPPSTRGTNIHSVNLVAHEMCGLLGGQRFIFAGKAERSLNNRPRERDSISTSNLRNFPQLNGTNSLATVIQHEISHNLGADDCTNWDCVMNPTRPLFDKWCKPCADLIWNFRMR
jgi:hypothetical protein